MLIKSKPNLFIIEDNRLSQLILGTIINEKYDYAIFDFDSYEDCVNNTKETPRIILLDYNLPGLNGLDAIPKLKAKWPNAQIVVVSSEKDLTLIKKLLKSDIADYVEKAGDIEQDVSAGIEQAEKLLKIRKL